MKQLRHTSHDYTEQDLPRNRREVFLDCWREQWRVILRLGLISLAALAPALLVLWMRDADLARSLAAGSTAADALRVANARWGVPLSLAVSLFFFLYAGVVRVVRQLVWREPIFFWDDLRNGWKHDACRFALTALFVCAARLAIGLLSGSVVTYLLWGVWVTILLPAALWSLLLTVYYRIGVIGGIRSGLLYHIRTLPVTLGLLLLTALPVFLTVTLAPPLLRYPLLAVLALLWFVPLTMAWLLYACRLFDRTINRTQYPSVYRRGLRPDPSDPPQPPAPPSRQDGDSSDSSGEESP